MQNTNRTVLNISELNAEVSLFLKQGFPLLWVQGEISNFSQPRSGHFYFSLKDSTAQIRCAMFKNNNKHLDIKPENGLSVLVRGRIGLYEARGEFQLIAEHMEAAGAGLLQQEFEALKAKLAAKGYFDALFKKKIPSHPKKIGIISSPTGAALGDILTILQRRCPHIPVLIYPTMVQGDTAAACLEKAVRQANQDQRCDVIILSRGGGSREDLAAFNDENLAQALYELETPMISGIGHEIDFTLADFIADQRAPTPSAAAELASPERTQLQHDVQKITQKMQNLITHQHQQQSKQLDELKRRLTQTMQQQLTHKSHATELHKEQLQNNTPLHFIATKQQILAKKISQLQHTIKTNLHNKQADFALQLTQLNSLNPLHTLERGYAIIEEKKTQHIISSVNQLHIGDSITIKIKDGTLSSNITHIKKTTL